MLLRRLYHDELAQASYLIGCQATGEALVVDPNRDIEQYVDAAAREGLRITAVTETHIHADYVSGSRELAARTGARLVLSAMGPTEWQYSFADEPNVTLVRDGDTFGVGNVRIEVVHTPGHTPEHISFLVTDTRAADQPIGILTGDFVFVGDVGRPDLLERAAGYANTMEAGARVLFASLQRFRALPDFVQVWPAHGAGSACGKALGAVPSSTVGYEKLFNWAFQIPNEAGFVSAVLEGQPDPPVYFAQMKRINRDGPPPRPATPAVATNVGSLVAARESGLLLVDTRPADQFAAGHIPGALNLPANGPLLTWAGWLLPYDRPFGLLADEKALPGVLQSLSLIGLDNIAGVWAAGLVEAWEAAGLPLATYERQAAREAAATIARNGLTVLDVRTPDEFAQGHIPGSRHIPLGRLPNRLSELPPATPILVTCQAGSRSPIAASVLKAGGWATVIEMNDGFEGWQKAGQPVERGT